MRDAIVTWVEALPLPEPLLVVLIGMTPIFELRGAIPFARGILDMAATPAFVLGVLGNFIPVPFILWWLPPFMRWTEDHWGWLHRVLVRLHASTERRHTRRFEQLRDLALITFVAVPLPITGAWSGSLAAVVFGVPRRRAIPLIALGVVIAGIIVSLFWEGLGMALD
jgi:uncharacterized membrane protein